MSKIRWILDHVEGAQNLAEEGHLAFGTVDSWLIWCLTSGSVHATDVTNASRTMLFNIHTGKWDNELLDLFGIPALCFLKCDPLLPITALHRIRAFLRVFRFAVLRAINRRLCSGNAVLNRECAKNTYGTGCFMLMHTGNVAVESSHGLVSTIAASAPGSSRLEYALEGSVFVAGALIQWLRDELGIIKKAPRKARLLP